MGNALPVQEPTMDEILASIRRIIEGRDDSETPTQDHQAPMLMPIPDSAETESPAGEAASDAPEALDAVQPETKPRSSAYAALEDAQRNGPIGLKAVNDEGKTPFAGAKSSEVERQVASQMEELATVSVARMRAASLEEAVRGFRQHGAEADEVNESDATGAEVNTQVFSDEFDEAAFATELLVNAGLMDEPVLQPESVSSAEAVKLRLAYPERPAEGELEAEKALETAISAATGRPKETASVEQSSVEEDGLDEVLATSLETTVEAATRGALVSLISDNAETKVSASFSELAAVLRDEQAQRMDATVREMLQPMLSDWLEDNLPIIVERLVREEIERVARGPKRA
ncbi:hypothetical protein FP2506_04881 [Fulvimarina pelagi HTCC2506]|uniref:DUF2497 domain-containing protein n=2 Tax=Fulvimarina pelagi TaxID=217511 RepID=Q0FZQ6_9HYPH|nr:DUF2497 domain-containing protein [Fulvimarina pelagi]EAU40535.1 hypothetical protein FP2506_04881 [Fulvimarina pelagi HTCC2506]BAT31558.1 hypothetical protein [Fulvimarina pelagi]